MATEESDQKDTKVMDVAKPGESTPQTGSKPMVVGHKSMAGDPTIKSDETTDEESATKDSEAMKLSTSKKIVLQPLSKDPDETAEEPTTTVSKTEATTTLEDDKKTTATDPDDQTDAPAEQKSETPKKTPEEIKDDHTKEVEEREASLQKLIKSGEYHVQINDASSSTIKTYLITFLVVAVFGSLVLAVLADLDLIDLGFNLPFDFL